MTGSLQIKNDTYYIVLNLYKDGKRRPKWISTGLSSKGNKRKAEQMLRDTLQQYEQQPEHAGRDRRKFCVIDEPRQYENLRLSQE